MELRRRKTETVMSKVTRDLLELFFMLLTVGLIISVLTGPYVAVRRGDCRPARLIEYFPTHYIFCSLFVDIKR